MTSSDHPTHSKNDHTVSKTNNNLLGSWVSGSARGFIDGLLSSGALGKTMGKTIDGVVKTATSEGPSSASAIQKPVSSSVSLQQVMQKSLVVLVPGFFAFETHHQAAHFLFGHLASAKYDPSVSFSPESSSSTVALALLEKVRNHSLHFVAGAAGGFTYGLALSVIEFSLTRKAMVDHTLSHGALFGGFDCFNDIHNHLLKVNEPDANTLIPFEYRQPYSTALSGGFAGMMQRLVVDLMSLTSAPRSTTSLWWWVSRAIAPTRIILSFPGSAAAFSANVYLRRVFASEGGGHHWTEPFFFSHSHSFLKWC